eukprot:scaffold43968_cov61-Phaeocystis_antarctica.AAC.3
MHSSKLEPSSTLQVSWGSGPEFPLSHPDPPAACSVHLSRVTSRVGLALAQAQHAAPHGPYGPARVDARLEDRRAGDDDVGPGGGGRVDGARREAAVDLDVEGRVGVPQGEHLGHHVGHERLAAEAGLDRHDQHLVRVGVRVRVGIEVRAEVSGQWSG